MASGGGRERPDWVFPTLTLVGVLALCLLAWLLFPSIYRFMQDQYCVASGSTNC